MWMCNFRICDFQKKKKKKTVANLDLIVEHSTGGVIVEWISRWAVEDTKKISTVLNDTINMNAKHL